MKKQRSTVLILITVICAFYLWELLDSQIINVLALVSIDYLRASNEWYRLLTVALLHDTSSSIPIHLAFNMLALHSLGTPIETLLGRTRFLIIFLFSLLSGSIASAFYLGWNGYSIGASGAVFGLFGAFIALGRRLGSEVKGIVIIIIVNFAVGFTIGGVDWRAHLGGLVGGFLIARALLLLNATK